MKTEDTEDFLSTAREQYEQGREADAADRKVAEDDNRFSYADDTNLEQWDKKAKALRKGKRPILQWNRIPTYTQRIANESRKNKPSIKISRGDEIATKATAEYLQGRIRHIEYDSNVDTARDTTGKQQVTTARAFLRVSTEWIPGTQKQRICVDAIPDQFTVVWDPTDLTYNKDKSDFCFVIRILSEADYERKYGEKAKENAINFASDNKGLNEWVYCGKNADCFQVADYWFRKYEDRVVPATDTQPERKEKVPVVYSCVIDGTQILKPVEKWMGSTIPLIPVWGEQAMVEGEQRTFSLIRNVKTPQRDLNLAVATLAELVGQMPKSPIMVPDGGIAANHEADWKNAHISPVAYLIYQMYDGDGRQINKPERITQEAPIQACLEWIAQCIDAIKAGMGIFDAALGAKSNEQSGVAIERRKVQGELTNLHFPDNQMRSNKYLGEILVELITKMEREGSYPIRTEDGKTHIVPMGVEHPDWKTGEPVTHDLSQGQYGVYVSQGPSYDSQRQELKDRDQELVAAAPELIWVFGDQMFAADDAPGSEERADRMKRAIQMKTPGLIQEKGNQPDPQALQQQVQQLGQQLQTTEAFAKDLHAKLDGKQLELANAVKLKEMDLDFQREKLKVDDENAKLKVASVEGIAELEQQIAVLEARTDRVHELLQMQATQAHAAAAQQTDQQHQAGEAEAQRQASADSQQNAQEHASAEAEAGRQAAAEQAQQGAE